MFSRHNDGKNVRDKVSCARNILRRIVLNNKNNWTSELDLTMERWHTDWFRYRLILKKVFHESGEKMHEQIKMT